MNACATDWRRSKRLSSNTAADFLSKTDLYLQYMNMQNWLNHVSRVEDITYRKQLLDSRPIGRRRPGRPSQSVLDGYNRKAETVIYWPNFVTKRRKRRSKWASRHHVQRCKVATNAFGKSVYSAVVNQWYKSNVIQIFQCICVQHKNSASRLLSCTSKDDENWKKLGTVTLYKSFSLVTWLTFPEHDK
jgi:hypothetical protein